jgi:hypothetical protein
MVPFRPLRMKALLSRTSCHTKGADILAGLVKPTSGAEHCHGPSCTARSSSAQLPQAAGSRWLRHTCTTTRPSSRGTKRAARALRQSLKCRPIDFGAAIRCRLGGSCYDTMLQAGRNKQLAQGIRWCGNHCQSSTCRLGQRNRNELNSKTPLAPSPLEFLVQYASHPVRRSTTAHSHAGRTCGRALAPHVTQTAKNGNRLRD